MRDLQEDLHVKIDKIINASVHHDASLVVMWDLAPEAFFRSDNIGRVTEANQAYLKLWGFDTLDEARGDDWLHLLTDEARVLAGERVAMVFEFPRVWSFDSELKDGRCVRIIGHPVYEANGSFIGFTGAVTEGPRWDAE